MPRTASLIGAALMLGAAATALAAPSGQTIGFTCFACHGDMGKGTATIPGLAGRSADSIYEQLIAFKTGKRPATVMDRHAKGYSDEELRAVAEYFASLPAK
ncbi:MAG: c-type cytochrome [Halothiobacillaceae bacterium]